MPPCIWAAIRFSWSLRLAPLDVNSSGDGDDDEQQQGEGSKGEEAHATSITGPAFARDLMASAHTSVTIREKSAGLDLSRAVDQFSGELAEPRIRYGDKMIALMSAG